MNKDEGHSLISIETHGCLRANIHQAGIGTILRALQKALKTDSEQQPLSAHPFRLGAAVHLSGRSELLGRIMLRVGWQTVSTEIKNLTNWVCKN